MADVGASEHMWESDHAPRATTVVLAVIPGLGDNGGAEQSLVAMAPGLASSDIELHVAVLTGRDALVGSLRSCGVHVHDLSGCTGLRRQVGALRSLIGDTRASLVHATLFDAAVPAQLATVASHVPVLVTWASTTYGRERFDEPGARPAVINAYRAVEWAAGKVSRSWYHAVTPGVARCNARALRVPGDRVLVGERGRDPALFRPGPVPSEGSRRPLILAVGRQEPVKGYDVLLRSFDEVAEAWPDVQLLVVGREGSATPALHRLRGRLRHGNRVEFAGEQEDVVDVMRRATMLVCSSWREGAAGAVIEAMGVGLPVVTVELQGLEGITIDGLNAAVVSRDYLASGIDRLLADPDLAQRLAVGGRRTFGERFTLERSTRRMSEIYRAVACARPGR